jgi:hypothetical protein
MNPFDMTLYVASLPIAFLLNSSIFWTITGAVAGVVLVYRMVEGLYRFVSWFSLRNVEKSLIRLADWMEKK